MVAYAFQSQQYQARYGSDGGGLPPGKYKVIIEKTEAMPTKDGSGNYLAITLKSIEGVTQGQTQIDRLNLFNVNPQTVEIANKQLAAYCVVTNKLQFQDTSELHNIPFMVEIGQQRANPDYTEVKKLYDINGNEPGKGAQPQQSAPQSGPPAGFGAAGGGFTPAPQQNGGWNPGAGQPAAQQAWDGGGQAQPQPGQQPQQQPQQQGGAPWSQPGQQPGQQSGWQPQPGQAAPGWGQR